MKLLTKEQEQAHYNATLQGGIMGGLGGLAVGAVGVLAGSRRYQFVRQLTLPLKAFLITSSGTFAGIVSADHWSRRFERQQNPIDQEYDKRQREQAEASSAGKTFTQRAMDFGKKERYKIVAASWIASMFAAFAIVNRNKYLTGQQKLVQARVYAQFLTVGVLVATAAFEISDRNNETGRYETIQVIDPTDPEHKRKIEKQKLVEDRGDGDDLWKDMIAAEEQRLKEQEESEKEMREQQHKKDEKKKKSEKKSSGDGKKSGTDDKKSGGDEKKSDTNEKKSGTEHTKGKQQQGDKAPTANDARNNDDEKSKAKDNKKGPKKDE